MKKRKKRTELSDIDEEVKEVKGRNDGEKCNDETEYKRRGKFYLFASRQKIISLPRIFYVLHFVPESVHQNMLQSR
jgi:hypothetical protein